MTTTPPIVEDMLPLPPNLKSKLFFSYLPGTEFFEVEWFTGQNGSEYGILFSQNPAGIKAYIVVVKVPVKTTFVFYSVPWINQELLEKLKCCPSF